MYVGVCLCVSVIDPSAYMCVYVHVWVSISDVVFMCGCMCVQCMYVCMCVSAKYVTNVEWIL